MDKESNTVWRLTTEDFRIVIEDTYPLLTETEVNMAVQIAREKFNIDDWAQVVNDFVLVNMEDIKGK